MKLSLGQIWALLLKHSNHFWRPPLLLLHQKVEANELKFITSLWNLHLLHSLSQYLQISSNTTNIYIIIYNYIFVWDWMCRIGLARFMSLLNSIYVWHGTCNADNTTMDLGLGCVVDICGDQTSDILYLFLAIRLSWYMAWKTYICLTFSLFLVIFSFSPAKLHVLIYMPSQKVTDKCPRWLESPKS